MAMTINTNRSASIANRALTETTRAMDRALAKLSSGQRVESARDDAASLAIGSRLRSQLASLRAYQQNAQQSTALLQVAEGAYQRVDAMFNRMRALTTQAQSSNLSMTERGMLDTEYQQLKAEVTRLAQSTTFGGQQLFASGDVTFNAASTSFGANNTNFGYAVADFNGDGQTDLINSGIISGNAAFRIQYGNANGSYSAGGIVNYGTTSVRNVVTGDFDGDLDQDIALWNEGNNSIDVLLNSGNGTFAVSYQLTGYSNLTDLVAGDLNNDGVTDLAASSSGSFNITSIFMNRGGTSASTAVTASGQSNGTLSIGDMNKDGWNDIVLLYNSVRTLLNNGSQGFTVTAAQNGSGFVTQNDSSGLVDINGDGYLDVVSSTFGSSNLQINLNNGAGGWLATQQAAMGGVLFDGTVGDFNGDGYFDLIGNLNGGGQMIVRQGNGNGTFGTAFNASTLHNGFLGVYDLNRDGRSDVINYGLAGFRTVTSSSQEGLQGSIRISETSSGNIAQRIGSANLGALDASLVYSSIATRGGAIAAERGITNALELIGKYRAAVGATINRLEQAGSNIATQIENLELARSAYLDLDIAAEMAKYTALQITQQAGISMLAQANQTQSLLLRLIQGGA